MRDTAGTGGPLAGGVFSPGSDLSTSQCLESVLPEIVGVSRILANSFTVPTHTLLKIS